MSAYDKVTAARAKGRPTGMDFITNIFDDFIEMHGDRRFGDDKAVIAGIARLNAMGSSTFPSAVERGIRLKV